MPAIRTSRLLALIAAALLMAGAGCNRGNNDDEADVTEPPEETPTVEAVADFQLVGLIDEAFAGQLPPVDLPVDAFDRGAIDAGASPGTSPSPAGTPVGAQPTRGGILRIQIEDLSDDLKEACGLASDSIVHIYWTTQTFFEPADVLDDVEDEIEDETAGITGRIFRSDELGDTSEPTPEATVATTGSPAATTPAASVAPTGSADCLLVAEQIGLAQTTLPTPRPVARTAAPTSVPTPTASAASPPATTAPASSPSASPIGSVLPPTATPDTQ